MKRRLLLRGRLHAHIWMHGRRQRDVYMTAVRDAAQTMMMVER